MDNHLIDNTICPISLGRENELCAGTEQTGLGHYRSIRFGGGLHRHLSPSGDVACVSFSIHLMAIPPADRNHDDQYLIIFNFINQAVAHTTQLDFVPILVPRKPGSRETWCFASFDQFF